MHSEKHLKCDECEKMFSNVRSLNHHKKVVHVLRSFKCDQCKFRSKTKFDLQTHIKGVHDGVQVQKTLNATYVIFKEQNKIWKNTKKRFTKIRKIGFVKHVHFQHISNMLFKHICEFTLVKNRTNVQHAISSFHKVILQNHTVKIKRYKKYKLWTLNFHRECWEFV